MTGPTVLTVSEVAARMRVSKMTVYRLIQNEEIRAHRIGRGYRISVRDFADY